MKAPVKMFRLAGVSLAVWIALSAPVRAGTGQRGTSGADFLKLGIGARAIGLGNATVADMRDATALYWNPAAMISVPGQSVAFSHVPYVDSIYYDSLSYVNHRAKDRAFGLMVNYLSIGDIAKTDVTGVEIGNAKPSDLSAAAGYAARLNGFSFGVAGKFIRSTVVDSASTLAADIGVLTPDYFGGRVAFAGAASNLGGKLKFDQADPLPRTLTLGSRVKIFNPWNVNLDVICPRDNAVHYAVGSEYRFSVSDKWALAARGGYNSRGSGDVDGSGGLSFGMGLGFRGVAVDYAYRMLGNNWNTQAISLTLGF